MAYFISDIKQAKQFQLVDIEGIPILPTTRSVKPQESFEFTIKLERIPLELTRFHLTQGKTEYKGGDTQWNAIHFMNIDLVK